MTSARARAVGRAQNKLNQTILSDFVGWASSSPDKLDDLYESPHATQCVLRALPPVARLYVARVLYLPAAAPEFSPSVFREALCRRTRARDRHDSALNTLRALRVFVPLSDGDDGGGGGAGAARLALNPAFARQLRLSVACMVPPVFGGPVDGVAARDVPSLDLFSARRLERVLNFSIGGDAEDASGVPHAAAAPRQEIQNALSSTRILAPCDGGAFMQITSTGFQFLLKDSSAQVWVLLRDVINNSFAGAELEALNFVFQLSFARSGFPYALDSVSSEQRRLVACLDELGIIAVDGSFFFPTPLGIGLVASASRSADDTTRAARQTLASAKSSGDIEIVVETNFRLYAYTTSSFQTNLLSLFTHMRYQLPNLVVGHLTREKVREALVNGITADQIIGFLNSHAHPRMKGGTIPDTVRDEIKLWEAEQERVQFLSGFLLSVFESAAQFEKVLAYANDLSACLWHNAAHGQLVVLKDEYTRIRNYIKRQ